MILRVAKDKLVISALGFDPTKWMDVIRDTMLLPVREEAGLGSPPDPFYTNSSECINNVYFKGQGRL